MEESRNVFDLLGKIEWEGGMLEVISGYGMGDIEDYDVPDDIKDDWEEIANVLYSIDADVDGLYRRIVEYSVKYGNKELD